MLLNLTSIRLDGNTQLRDGLQQDIVKEYAQAMQDGAVFPAAIVFYDEQDYWLADGFHRYAATELNGWESLEVDIQYGTRQDALDYACGANATHGLRRTGKHKRIAVEMMLKAHTDWADNRIAKHVGVSQATVGTIRKELLSSYQIDKIEERKAVRDNKEYIIRTPKELEQTYPDLFQEVVTRAREGYVEKGEDTAQSLEKKYEEAARALAREYEEKSRKLVTQSRKELEQRVKDFDEARKRSIQTLQQEKGGLLREIDRLKTRKPEPLDSSALRSLQAQIDQKQQELSIKQKEIEREERQRQENASRITWVIVAGNFMNALRDLMLRAPLEIDISSFNELDWGRLDELLQAFPAAWEILQKLQQRRTAIESDTASEEAFIVNIPLIEESMIVDSK